MAKKKTKLKKTDQKYVDGRINQAIARFRRRIKHALLGGVALVLLWILSYSFIPVPTTPYMLSESRRIGSVDYHWVSADAMSPYILRAVVAAEDANFCHHWGFDLAAIRAAIDDGANRGASTITQQVVKNAFLWHGRSWPRKVLETAITPLVELTWSKRRILEVYLNIAEFDTGVFGIEAASRHYFGVGPEDLTQHQAGRLAAILPSPKTRSAGKPGPYVQRRGRQIADGAATIARDGRSSCFEH